MRTWTLNDSIEKSRILNFEMNSVVTEGFKSPSFIKNGVFGHIFKGILINGKGGTPPPLTRKFCDSGC